MNDNTNSAIMANKQEP